MKVMNERYNHLIQNLYHKPNQAYCRSSKRNNLLDKVNNGLLTSEQIITALEDDNISNKIPLILDNQNINIDG